MKLVSQFEAATVGTAELFSLRKVAFIAFADAPRGSQAQRDALATMQAVEKELAKRTHAP
jgi:hypothetical protein